MVENVEMNVYFSQVEREGELRKQEKKNQGWFSGWFFGSTQKESEDVSKEGANLGK